MIKSLATRTIPTDPADWSLADAQAALGSVVDAGPTLPGLLSSLAYLRGDHKQDWKVYRGPGIDANGDLSHESRVKLAQQWTPVPEVEGCSQERVSGTCKTEADVGLEWLMPDGQQEAPEAEREAWMHFMRAAWEAKEFWGKVKKIPEHTTAAGWGCLRWFVSRDALQQGEDGRATVPRQATREEAARIVHLVAPDPASCAVYVDPDTQRETAVFTYHDDAGLPAAEVWFARGDRTVLRRLENAAEAEVEYPWGGLLPIVQANLTQLLTEPVRALQASLDATSTGLFRNGLNHGYSQHFQLDALPAGHWTETEPVAGADFTLVQPDGSMLYYEADQAASLGPATIHYPQGVPYIAEYDDAGRPKRVERTSPKVQYHEPSAPDNIIRTADWYIRQIREAFKQGHRVAGDGGTAEASGDAYEQKRAAFQDLLDMDAQALQVLVARTWTVGTVICDWLAGADEPVFPTRWSVSVTMRPNAGHVSSGRQQEIRANVDAGLVSEDTGRQQLGVQDTAAERARLQEQQALAVMLKRNEVARSFIDAGVDPVFAWTQAGYDEVTAERLAQSDGGRTEQ